MEVKLYKNKPKKAQKWFSFFESKKSQWQLYFDGKSLYLTQVFKSKVKPLFLKLPLLRKPNEETILQMVVMWRKAEEKFFGNEETYSEFYMLEVVHGLFAELDKRNYA